MDTATHITMGIALGGLATLDPVVQQDPHLFQAVFIGTVVGSNAPDFDTILKLRNNAVYIRNHRGITHSLPSIFMWGAGITVLIHTFMPEVHFMRLFLWTLLAVGIHVLVDIFNAYGTQAMRPISKQWIAYGFINTFDYFIFGVHVVGIVAWLLGANPGPTFLILYIVIILYYVKRYFDKKAIIKAVNEYIPEVDHVVTRPTIRNNLWQVCVITKKKFFVAKFEDKTLKIKDEYIRKPLPDLPEIELALEDDNIQAFLSFSPVYRWEVTKSDDEIEIRFIDLRYRAKGRYPFVAVVKFDHNLNKRNSYTGWVYSEDKLQKKLTPATS
ncbi:metal-dependent hydrolase [Salirhabdus salicampi]|uniref:metal-dependent hydrolase n=1 Tax=Salirhabdus salicampi TaxID=476102 RepID=UPI0020C535B3|nr:metal-dependent hydrolase [Salirhabdus salicampi]MCP8617965.1 metal-dependent hydrolase [Salirhabdus salicampi]